MSGAVRSGKKMTTWKEQTLIRRGDVSDILQQHLRIAQHPIPENTVGSLYCVDGIAAAAVAIMDYLEDRALAQKEAENGREED